MKKHKIICNLLVFSLLLIVLSMSFISCDTEKTDLDKNQIDAEDFVIKGINLPLVGFMGTEGEDLIIPELFEDEGKRYRVTSIDESAFCNRINLKSITIPDSVTTIGRGAFDGCTNLTSITISDSVTSIGEAIFHRCSNLTGITFKGTVAQWNAITKGDRWNLDVPATEVICSDGVIKLS